MRLRQIEVFYHVYRAGSISGAARDLNVSQPSVSKVLRHAEDQLGVELFLRRKGRLVPTAAAHELYAEAEDLYLRLSTFNRSLENIGNRRGGHLRLGVLPSLSLSLGPEMISCMLEADGETTFELTTLHTVEMLGALQEKQIDLAIGFEEIRDDRVSAIQIGEGAMVLVAGKPITSTADLADPRFVDGAPFVSMRDSGPLGRLVTETMKARAIVPKEIVSAHTYHVALSLVRKRIGLTITDEFTAYSHLGSGLHRYPLSDFPTYPIYAASLKDHPEQALITRGVAHASDATAKLQSGIRTLQLKHP